MLMKTGVLCAPLAALAFTVMFEWPVFASQRVGSTFSIIGAGDLKRRPDVAYDSQNGVYLVVTANPDLRGAFVSAGGQILSGVFAIDGGGASQQAARVAYSPDAGAFLVTWLDWRNGDISAVWGRLVKYSASGPVFVSGEFQIDQDGFEAHSEMGAAVAYSTGSKEFLVVWRQNRYDGVANDIRARRISSTGAFLGNEFAITADADWQAEPDVAYNPQTNQFFVIWSHSDNSGDFAEGRRVQAGTGALPDASPVRLGGGVFVTVPMIEFDSSTGGFLAAWYQNTVAPVFYGRGLSSAGTPTGTVFPIATDYGSYDGFDISRNPVSGTTLAVFHGYTEEDAGVELSTTYVPGTVTILTGSGGTGNFNPRLATLTSAAEWLLVTSRSLNQIVGQRVGSSGGSSGGTTPLSVTVSASHSFPVVEGTTITWTAQHSGGSAGVQYQFWRYTEGSGWSIGQAWSSTNTFAWAPAAGTHAIQVWVKNSDSANPYDAYAAPGQFTVNAAAARLSSLQASTTFPSAPNVTVTWTATPATSGSFEYKFWRFKEGQGWTLVQDWSSFNTFTWIVSEGRYAIQAWIRRVGSSANYEDWKSTGYFDVIASSPARLTSLTASTTFPAAPTTTITWTATGSGGSGPLEYKFWLYNWSTATWSVLRDWAPGNQASWTPGTFTGQHALQVWVRTQGSGVAFEDWKGTDYFNITGSTGLTMVTDRPLSGLREGDRVTWTAQMQGTGTWEYQVWTYSNGTWTMQQNYGGEASFGWYPTAGTHAVQIWSRQAGTSAKYERWVSSGWFTVQNP